MLQSICNAECVRIDHQQMRKSHSCSEMYDEDDDDENLIMTGKKLTFLTIILAHDSNRSMWKNHQQMIKLG